MGPDPARTPRQKRLALIVGLLLGLLIMGALLWIIGTWPGPGWREPGPQVPTAPGPRM